VHALIRNLAATALVAAALAGPEPLAGQEPVGRDTLDLAGLIDRAREANPEIRAAQERAAAARERREAAGAPPDPRLAAGLVNALVSDPLSSEDMMTMRMIQIGQVLPFPGKLALEREVAGAELAEVEAEHDRVERSVLAEVRKTYFDLWVLDRALEIVHRNYDLLSDFVSVTRTRYQVGTGTQQDLLKAQVEATRLGEEILDLAQRRTAAAAALNALLDHPADTPLGEPALPERIERAATPETGAPVRFTVAVLDGDPVEDDGTPIPDLAELQRIAAEHSPELRASAARIARARAAAALAGKAALPDFDVSLGYGQRNGREDMLTAMVSVPLPIFQGRKQDRLAAAGEAEAQGAEASHRALVNDVNARLAALRAALLRTRDRIALFRDAILPQSRAALESAVAGYPVAKVDFLTLLDDQATVFRNDLEYRRLLADFGRDLAELERTVGTEVVR
jgi:outer membrane protein TolC